jgi:hypothetical protein
MQRTRSRTGASGDRQRALEGLRLVARDGAVLRAASRRPGSSSRAEHREDLRAELPEHRPAHHHRLRRSWSASPAGEERSPSRSSPGARPHQRRHRAVRGPLRLQQGAHRGRGRAPRPHHRGAADDPGEKIIAAHAWSTPPTGQARRARGGKPGDALFVRTDVRFSHEYVTPMAEALFRAASAKDAKVTEPESVFAFRDHLTFLDRVMPEAHVKMGLRSRPVARHRAGGVHQEAGRQALRRGARAARRWAQRGHLPQQGHRGHRLPGQVVAGTDSPHLHGGRARLLRVRRGLDRHGQRLVHQGRARAVPESVRFNLRGALRPGVTPRT